MTSRRSFFLLVLIGLHGLAASCVAQPAGFGPGAARVVDDLCERKVVVLAELPSHGEARGFEVKAHLVRTLVDRCGFDAVFFEAPLYEFEGFREATDRGDASQDRLDAAIGGFWSSPDLADWRRWLYDRALAGRLHLAGLDDQVSATSNHARAVLPDLVADALPGPHAGPCREAVDRNLRWRYDDEHPFDDGVLEHLGACVHEALERRSNGSGRRVPRETKMLENLATFYDRWARPEVAADRDGVMARNFVWHTGRLPDSTRIVVWTATVHGARRQVDLPHRPLGAWLSEEYRDRMAVVGFTAFGGRSSMAGGPVQRLPDAPPESLEAIATARDTAWVYLDADALNAAGAVPSRLLGQFRSTDWSLLLDGVLVIREEAAPGSDRRE